MNLTGSGTERSELDTGADVSGKRRESEKGRAELQYFAGRQPVPAWILERGPGGISVRGGRRSADVQQKNAHFLQRGVRMDFSILYALQHLHNAVLDRVMVGITSLGNAGWIWIALTAVFLILPKYRKCGVRMAIALILDLILCNLVLKPLAARPRPCWIDEQVKLLVAAPKDYSFPSGHSAASFAAAVSIFVMHKKEGAAALILACLIAFSRLYLFVHFPTDVLAGIAVGFICAFLAAKIQNGFLLRSRGR